MFPISKITIMYLCDKTKCKDCSMDFNTCVHTSDRNYSINYKNTKGPTVDDLNNSAKFELYEIGQQYSSNDVYEAYEILCREKYANETTS